MASNFFTNWIQVFTWWYTGFPRELARQQKLAFLAVLNFFSFEILLKTLFQPWRKDTHSYERKTLQEKVETLGLNFISRFFGLAIRTSAMALGAVVLVLLLLFYIVMWFAWVIAPFAAIILLVLAIREFQIGGR